MALYANKNGKAKRVSNYETKYMLTLRDLFPSNRVTCQLYLIKKKDAPTGSLKNIYSVQDNSALVRKIFREYLMLVLKQVAKGNCAMKFPNRSNSTLFLGEMHEKAVQHKVQNGKLDHIDLLKSNFKVPYITYKISSKQKRQDLKVFVPKSIYQHIIKSAHERVKPSKIPYEFMYFLPQLYEEYSYLEENGLRKLVMDLLKRMAKLINQGHEMRFVSNEGEIRFFRPLGAKHDKVMKEVYNKYKQNGGAKRK